MTLSRDMAVVPVTDGSVLTLLIEFANAVTDARLAERITLLSEYTERFQALANRDAPGSGSSAKADTHRAAEGDVVGLHRTDVQRLMHPVLLYLRGHGVAPRIAEEASERAVDAAYRGIVAKQAAPAINTTAGEAGS